MPIYVLFDPDTGPTFLISLQAWTRLSMTFQCLPLILSCIQTSLSWEASQSSCHNTVPFFRISFLGSL